jgi:hypothetical protein
MKSTRLLMLALLATLAPAHAESAEARKPLTDPAAPGLSRLQPLRARPVIASVAPTGCIKPGVTVTLTGSQFGADPSGGYRLAILLGSPPLKDITATTWSPTKITFTLPATLGIAAGSAFTLGLRSGAAFVASLPLTLCAAIEEKVLVGAIKLPSNASLNAVQTAKTPPPAVRKRKPKKARKTRAGKTIVAGKIIGGRASAFAGLWSRARNDDAGGPPAIDSVVPADCVNVGSAATAVGVNLGTSSSASGLSLAIQVDEAQPIGVAASSWSPTGIGFVVPPQAGELGWFALGMVYQGEFFPQVYVYTCDAYGGDSWGYDYGGDYGGDYGDYGGDYEYGDEGAPTGAAPAAVPKGARALAAGAVNIQVAPAPVPAAGTVESPPPAGKRVVGGKLLAMKALAGRGLRKVNKECDLFDANCPCCRKDDSVCLEKQGDSEDGSSTWVVRWRLGATTADGAGAYGARSAELDVEAVTGLQCDPAASGSEQDGFSTATLNCR